MNINEATIAMVPLIEAVMYFLLYEAFLERRFDKPWKTLCGLLLLAAMIAVSNYFFLHSIYNTFGITLAIVIVSMVFYKSRISYSLIIALLGVLLSSVIELLVTSLIAVVFNMTVQETVIIPEYVLLGIVVSKIFGLSVCNIIRIMNKNRRIKLGTSYWMMFFLLFFNAIATIFLLFRFSYELRSTIYNNWSMLCAIGLLCSTFFALYLYERQARQSLAIRRQEQYEQHLRSQVKHMDDILIKQEELRRFKHDYVNQLVTLKGYFAHQDPRSGEQYIDQLLQTTQTVQPSIHTGNIALDAILSTKKALAESKSITFSENLHIVRELPLAPADICAIFGNALDNAIEASARCPEAERRIDLLLIQRDNRLTCELTNTMPPHQPLTLQTIKPDKENHGFGLRNLTESLEKYGSTPRIETDDQTFTLKFIIYDPYDPHDPT